MPDPKPKPEPEPKTPPPQTPPKHPPLNPEPFFYKSHDGNPKTATKPATKAD